MFVSKSVPETETGRCPSFFLSSSVEIPEPTCVMGYALLSCAPKAPSLSRRLVL
jgi:hypothetical protein